MKRYLVGAVVAIASLSAQSTARADAPKVITLTQIACQFLESESGVDRKYKTSKKADCEAINAATAGARLAQAAPLQLRAGSYIFRVTNKDVPYELGFWLRGAGLRRLTLPGVSGGGLMPGTARDYAIELVAGEYLYSCPLNTTPDYRLIVAD